MGRVGADAPPSQPSHEPRYHLADDRFGPGLTESRIRGVPSVRGLDAELPFVVSPSACSGQALSNHERPFDKLRANGRRELRLITRRVSLPNLDSRIEG